MRILSIGDIHGRDKWKFLTHDDPYTYGSWKDAVESGESPFDEKWRNLPFMSFDKIIFVGDYVDSRNLSNDQILGNLKEIIYFKQALGDRVVLLVGNHDVQYMVKNQVCSGYRPEMKYDLEELFKSHSNLFQLAYEIETPSRKYLWTHAGVSSEWYKTFLKELSSPDIRYGNILEEYNPESIADHLNLGWWFKLTTIFRIDWYSGGSDLWAGPIWVRPGVLEDHPMKDLSQIMGHTPQRGVTKRSVKNGAVHYYIDCLEEEDGNGLDITLEPVISP